MIIAFIVIVVLLLVLILLTKGRRLAGVRIATVRYQDFFKPTNL